MTQYSEETKKTVLDGLSELGGQANEAELCFHLQGDMPEWQVKEVLHELFTDCDVVFDTATGDYFLPTAEAVHRVLAGEL